jgi:hypothetical protein
MKLRRANAVPLSNVVPHPRNLSKRKANRRRVLPRQDRGRRSGPERHLPSNGRPAASRRWPLRGFRLRIHARPGRGPQQAGLHRLEPGPGRGALSHAVCCQ